MLAQGPKIFYFSAIALIKVLVAARIVLRKFAGSFKACLPIGVLKTDSSVDRMFDRLRVPGHKKCPSCAEQLPLSALLCDACDFNFLAGSLIRNDRMLPAPDAYAEPMSDPRAAAVGR